MPNTLEPDICMCNWCRPGWRTSKRDAHVHLVRWPVDTEELIAVIFLKREAHA